MSSVFLDLRTLSVVLMLTTVVLGWVMAFVWKTQKVYPGFGWWMLSNFTAAIGFFLLGMRGYAPDLISIIIGNSLAAGSMVLSFEGNRRFLGLAGSKLFSFSLLVFHALGIAYFTFAENQILARIAVSTLCLGLIAGRSAYIFFTPPKPTPTYRFAGITYVCFTGLMFARLILSFKYTRITDLLAPDWVQSLVFLTFLIFAIVWMFAYLILTNERLQVELNAVRFDLEKLAATDFLTGIANNRRFYETGEIEIQRARRFRHNLTLVMFDLDFFKQINDRSGHAAGDKVLIEIAAVCRRTLRSIDIFGRLGGEEFAVLLPHTDLEGGKTVAEMLRAAIERMTIEIAPAEIIKITASFGVTELKNTDTQIQTVLNRADAVLYQAKNSGRNRIAADAPKVAHETAAFV